jgi:type III secretory pathway component EscT
MVAVFIDQLGVAPFALGAARGLGFALVLPLGWDLLGITQRVALAVGLGIGVPGAAADLSYLVIGLSMLIGALTAAPIALAADVAASVGEVLDAGRGVLIAEVLDPLQAVTASHLSVLFRFGLWTCFLVGGGLEISVTALSKTSTSPQDMAVFTPQDLLRSILTVFRSGMLLAAPVLLMFLVCEGMLAVLSRVSNGVALSTEAVALKIVVATLAAMQFLEWLQPAQLAAALYGR